MHFLSKAVRICLLIFVTHPASAGVCKLCLDLDTGKQSVVCSLCVIYNREIFTIFSYIVISFNPEVTPCTKFIQY